MHLVLLHQLYYLIKKYLLNGHKYWLSLVSKSSTRSNLYWFKDLNSWSPFSNIISRSVPSHVVTEIKLFQHTDINDMQDHWMPAVAPHRRSPWWCMARTNFVGVPDLNSALFILKPGYLKLFNLFNELLLPNTKN